MFSIVIPAYNAEKTIGELLDSIFGSFTLSENEVIVIDDASIDKTFELVKDYDNVKLIRNEVNLGAAKSRNRGVREARGETIVFFDADVILHQDTLKKLMAKFQELPAGNALVGIYSKCSANKGFIAEFKALLDYYHWSVADSGEVTQFEPRCAIIDKDAFMTIGGFDENTEWEIEDYEFGWRFIDNKGQIYFDRSIQVGHHFPDKFSLLCRKFFQRGSCWMQLFLRRKKFDNVATTKEAGLSHIFGFLSPVFLLTTPFFKICGYLFVICFLLYLYFYRNFFKFIFQEKGLRFTLKAVLTQYALAIILGLAAIKGICCYIMEIFRHGKN